MKAFDEVIFLVGFTTVLGGVTYLMYLIATI